VAQPADPPDRTHVRVRQDVYTKGLGMPQRMWDHSHCCGAFQSGSPECNDGGTRGRFTGWHLTMHESMARYQYVYGLKPIGPHRRLADELLTPLRVKCPR
jgi:hypothetical protein